MIFLIVGEAAKKKLAANPVPGARVEYLSKWLDVADEEAVHRRTLSAEELLKIKLKFDELRPTKAITGCCCWKEALAPLQIAKLLKDALSSSDNFIYNGEFLYDTTNNPYWSELLGFDGLGLLVALPEAKVNNSTKIPL